MIGTGARTSGVEALPLQHLAALSDHRGVFEHAEHAAPRPEHGYCLDDVARGLQVCVSELRRSPLGPDPLGPDLLAPDLLTTYLRFVERAVTADGSAHNRMDGAGRWTDRPGLGDWWGRAVRALGLAWVHGHDADVRDRARAAFERAVQQRSPDVRATAFAAVGAAEVLAADPGSEPARRLLVDAAAALPVTEHADWPWPEARLRYANGALPEALLAAGAALADRGLTERGLAALSFLVLVETRDGHLSVTGVGGRGPHEHGPQFDQQPIEVAALAAAAARAYRLGHGDHWAGVVGSAWAWFGGANDVGVSMVDSVTGAGFDGLHAWGRNENRGAESTLAALLTAQLVRALPAALRVPAVTR